MRPPQLLRVFTSYNERGWHYGLWGKARRVAACNFLRTIDPEVGWGQMLPSVRAVNTPSQGPAGCGACNKRGEGKMQFQAGPHPVWPRAHQDSRPLILYAAKLRFARDTRLSSRFPPISTIRRNTGAKSEACKTLRK